MAGTKKVQQALTQPEVLERFLTDKNQAKTVRNIFVPIYSLDFNEEGEKAIRTVLEAPERWFFVSFFLGFIDRCLLSRFVLKPQREGGGNNVYGPDVKRALMEMRDSKERTAWIVMEKYSSSVLVK